MSNRERATEIYGTTPIPVVRAYGFLSFNHFEDIEVAICITCFRRGMYTSYVINK